MSMTTLAHDAHQPLGILPVITTLSFKLTHSAQIISVLAVSPGVAIRHCYNIKTCMQYFLLLRVLTILLGHNRSMLAIWLNLHIYPHHAVAK